MKPIEKNIRVVDEQGNEYEATYPKRARGLVKNGRARFVDANVICLACPPKNFLEDNMDININASEEKAPELTMEYILNRIDQLIYDTQHIHGAIEAIRNLAAEPPSMNAAPDCKAEAVAEIIKSREETNRKMIGFLEKMYDDLKPQREAKGVDINQLRVILETVCNLSDEPLEMLEAAWKIVKND